MNYYQHSTQRIELGAEDLILYSKSGMVAWDDVAAANRLLAEDTPRESGMRILILEGGAGALAVVMAREGADVRLYNDNLIAARMAKLTCEANDVQVSVYDSAITSQRDFFDLALMVNPKGRAYARLLITAAYRALKPNGRLYFCGAKAEGAQAIATDAGEIFDTNPITVRAKAHQRLNMVTKVGDQSTALPEQDTFIHNGLTFYTLPGVFSREGVDAGTTMLLSTLNEQICTGKHILDVGCGYGIIGMQAAKLGATSVSMVEVSFLALYCAQRGAQTNGFRGICRAFGSDLYSDIAEGEKYDLILSNPPFHAGHSVDTAASEALISGARERLSKGGALRLVANRFLAYDKLMRKVFTKVEIVKEDGKFWVLEGTDS
jgi:16S rRNA (guanine1207-N2)-methyltransferase